MALQRLTLFIINDEYSFYLFMNKHFRREYDLIHYNRNVDMIKQLYERKCDIVILNFDRLQIDEIDLSTVFHWCKQQYIPIITVVNRFDQQPLETLYSFSDVVFNHPMEVATLKAVLKKHGANRNQFLSHSLIDPLTNTYNSTFMKMEIERLLKEAIRSHEPLSLMYIEVDVNEKNVRKKTSAILLFIEIIKNNIRPTDIFGHFDKQHSFVFALPNTTYSEAQSLLARLQALFSESKDNFVTTSFFVKIVELTNEDSVDHLLKAIPFQSEEEKKAAREIAATSEQVTPQKVNIAIIDDDQLIRELLKQHLKDLDTDEFEIEIKTYSNGDEFFNDPWHRKNERFLLLIDRMMPKMDGLEVLQKIRAQYDRKRYICFILASRNSEADVTLAIQKGANDYMMKPLRLQELKARIRRLLRGTR